jgi:hypothetical protein
VEPAIRADVWKYLLRYFTFTATPEEREKIIKEKRFVSFIIMGDVTIK